MECVRVAVNIRPLVTAELLEGSTDCITVIPGEPQIQIGSHLYTFDHVFGSTGQKSTQIYEECVAPLVDALLHGYNGTVLAYGQTGSGKTYTMGTNYNGEGHDGGIIPKVMETIFSRVEQSKDSSEFLIRVSYIESILRTIRLAPFKKRNVQILKDLNGILKPSRSTRFRKNNYAEAEPLINNWAVPGTSTAPQVRSLRKVNNDQVAIAIDTLPGSDGKFEDEDDDKAHGFKSLTTSKIVPRFTRPVTDIVDGLWVSCERALMRQPALRLALIMYWAILHALVASLVV